VFEPDGELGADAVQFLCVHALLDLGKHASFFFEAGVMLDVRSEYP
jgi:hypothetical protein